MEKKKRIFYWIVIIGIMISFIPLVYICRYNCPSADDYNYVTPMLEDYYGLESIATE